MDTQQSASPAAFIDVLRMMKQCSQKITFYVVRAGRWHIYYIKLQFSLSVCLSVPLPPFRHDRWTATKFGTHIRVDTGLILRYTNLPTPPQRGPMGVLVVFRGSKNQKTGKCHELPRKSTKKSKPGGGWGGVEVLGGHKIKSPGSVMNCPENQYKKC